MQGNGEPILCHSCRITFPDRQTLWTHRQRYHRDNAYRCPLCQYVNSSRTTILERHLPNRHNRRDMTVRDLIAMGTEGSARTSGGPPRRRRDRAPRSPRPVRQTEARPASTTGPRETRKAESRTSSGAREAQSSHPATTSMEARAAQSPRPSTSTSSAQASPELGPSPRCEIGSPPPRTPGADARAVGVQTGTSHQDVHVQTDRPATPTRVGPMLDRHEWQPIAAILLMRTRTMVVSHQDGRTSTETTREYLLPEKSLPDSRAAPTTARAAPTPLPDEDSPVAPRRRRRAQPQPVTPADETASQKVMAPDSTSQSSAAWSDCHTPGMHPRNPPATSSWDTDEEE